MGKKADRIYELEQELSRVKDTNSVLEAWRSAWLHGISERDQINLQTTIGALTQLWEKLRVTNQTEAVMRISDLRASERSLKLNNQADLQNRQQIASLSDEIRVLRLANQQLTFQRDCATKGTEDHGWTLHAKDRRIEELETAIREHLKEVVGNSETHLSEYEHAFVDLAKVLGDDNAKG